MKLFVFEVERTSLLFMVSANKTLGMIFRFSHSCGLQDISRNIICLKSRKDARFFKTFNTRGISVLSFVKFRAFSTFGTLTSVVQFLLLGHAASLANYVRILGGFRYLLWGVGKLTRRKGYQQKGHF